YEWLWNNFLAQTGCCLSDERGLGKTIQTIALLLKYKETAKTAAPATASPGMLFSEEEMKGETLHAPLPRREGSGVGLPFHTSLVVAPASVVHNWMNELQRFAPTLLVCNYTGEASARRDKRKALLRWDVVVTTYHTLRADIELLAPLQFGIVVFDESQAFKTATSQVHHAVSRLAAVHCMALSGTPVENNLQELWSLMSVLNPHLLGSQHSFQQSFVNPIAHKMEQQRTELLQRLIMPYFLKRTKEQVLSDLPERQDEVVVCPMTDSQASLYATELSKARNEYMETRLAANGQQPSALNVLAAIQRLRQIANGEGKMQVVFERLESLRGTGHKVLLFSEYVSLLKRMGDEMQQRGWSYALLTGATQHREQVIDSFQRDAACQFFLISLKAGGVGLNLTAADYVFVLDPWWNVAAEEQAIARSHRIGQHRPVFVYRFVSENTLEQQILTPQERKQTLIDSVMPFICNSK
ncbi:MAG: DEAD/DEAH box helicase, partial [Prevotella sp.]|nr:DEAD/DEAH box helicase [Prevotella sp.]